MAAVGVETDSTVTVPANQFVDMLDALAELMVFEAALASFALEKMNSAVTTIDPAEAVTSTLSAAVNWAISLSRKSAASKLLMSPAMVKAVVTADLPSLATGIVGTTGVGAVSDARAGAPWPPPHSAVCFAGCESGAAARTLLLPRTDSFAAHVLEANAAEGSAREGEASMNSSAWARASSLSLVADEAWQARSRRATVSPPPSRARGAMERLAEAAAEAKRPA